MSDSDEKRMVVLVCGGRSFSDQRGVFEALDSIHRTKRITRILHGGGTGADALGAQWAAHRGIRVVAFPARWDLYGKAAGPLRNQQMLREEAPNLVLAFPGGRGTFDMIRRARGAGVAVIEVPPSTPDREQGFL